MRLKVLVTGGAGFIGSNLCERLVRNGHLVTCLDNLASGRYEYVRHLGRKHFTFLEGDILKTAFLERGVKGKDVVFHFAASADIRRSAKNTRLDLRQNTVGTWSVLETMRRKDVSSIVFASSSAVYGEVATNRPLEENSGPLCPISLYGASKLAAEGLITAYCHLYGFSALVYRFANIVGRNEHRGITVDLLKKLKRNPKVLEILGNGKQLKSYTDVDDCVNGVVYQLSNLRGKGAWEIYNIGTTDVITADQVARTIIDELGLGDVRLRHTGGSRGWPGDTRRCILSIRRLCSSGWRPRFSSEEAIRRTVRSLRRIYFD
jgi:UDP-glucose 4-epimerase